MVEISKIDEKIKDCRETIEVNKKRLSWPTLSWMLFVPLTSLTLLVAGIVGLLVGAKFMVENSWILIGIYLVALVSLPVYAIYLIHNHMIKRAPITIEKMKIEIAELELQRQTIIANDINARLKSYKKLLDDNAMTPEEFEAKKAEILNEAIK